MTKPQNVKDESIQACPSNNNSDSSSSNFDVYVRKITNVCSIIDYVNQKRENLIGHLKLKVLYWVHFSMVMFLLKS